jgi:regulator of cell morphogenesis and NO signaling
VAAELEAIPVQGDRTWTGLEPPALVDHIVTTHHRYLDAELPLLSALAAKVLSVHGGRHPELAEIKALVDGLRAELEPHLHQEEAVLFPAIHARCADRPDGPSRSLTDLVKGMEMEHDQAGDLLAALRRATTAYQVPDDACASYRSLFERLEALELDTHLHVHKENHALFPAVLRMTR